MKYLFVEQLLRCYKFESRQVGSRTAFALSVVGFKFAVDLDDDV